MLRRMNKRRRALRFSAIPLLLLLSACSAQRGQTDRYNGFTVRTEKTKEAAAASSPAPVRSEPDAGEGEDYVLNKSSMKFHYPDCAGVEGISEHNRLDFHGTRETALSMGYSPCKLCNP